MRNNDTYLQSGPKRPRFMQRVAKTHNCASSKRTTSSRCTSSKRTTSARCTGSKRVTSLAGVYQQGPEPEMVGPCERPSLSTAAAQRNSNRKRPTSNIESSCLQKAARHVNLKVKGLILELRVIGVSVASKSTRTDLQVLINI
jgi:hypothetical protein